MDIAPVTSVTGVVLTLDNGEAEFLRLALRAARDAWETAVGRNSAKTLAATADAWQLRIEEDLS